MAGKSEVIVRFIGDTLSLDRAMKSTHTKLGELGKLSVAAGAMIAGGLAMAAVGSIKAADKFEASQAKLRAAVEASGASWAANKGKIDTTSTSMEKYGFTASQVEDAMSRAVISTGSLSKATNRLQLAADLAKAKNMDLGSAMDMVDKAANGQLRPIKALGIDLPIAAGGALKLQQASTKLQLAQQHVKDLLVQYPDALDKASKHHAMYETAIGKVRTAQANLKTLQGESTLILDALSKKLGGQASAAADTFGGKVEALKAKSEDLGVKFGTALMPALTAVLNVVSPLVSWFGNLPGPMQVTAIALLAVGSAALIIVPKVLALKEALSKTSGPEGVGLLKGKMGGFASFLTGPWGLALGVATTVALPLLAGAFKKTSGQVSTFTDLIGLNAAALRDQAKAMVEGDIAKSPQMLTEMAALGITTSQMADAVLKGGDAMSILRGRLDDINTSGTKYVTSQGPHGGLSTIIDDQAKAARDLGSWLGVEKTNFDKASTAADAYGRTLGALPTVKGLAAGQGSGGGVKKYASGTSYHPGGLAVVGEQGPELVDLPRGSKVYPHGTGPGVGVGGGRGGGDIHIHQQGIMTGNANEFARAVITLLQNASKSGLKLGPV